MEGFTIKCNKCGKERVLINANNFGEEEHISIIHSYYGEETDIGCVCGNEIGDNPFL